MAMDDYLEPGKDDKPEAPRAELWERYKGYAIFLHPVYGFCICNIQRGTRINRRDYESLELCRRAIDRLPPPQTVGEILRDMATRRR